MSDFTHLHVHSHYSLLDGLGKIELLLERVKELGMDSLALTDHGVMYGVIDFVRTAQNMDIKPIIGMEAYLAPEGHKLKRGRVDASARHLTLLAQNNEGYQNLINLTTAAHLEGYYYKPRIDYDLLSEHGEGLIVLSGCLNGDIARAIAEHRRDEADQLIRWHLDVFGRERFYLEVQSHVTINEQKVVNEALIDFSKKYKLGLVATADTHYIHADDAEAQDVLLCVQTGKVVQDKDRMCMLGEDFSLKSPKEMREIWKGHPSAIENTQKISAMCQVNLEFGSSKLPHYPLPRGISANNALRGMCEQRLLECYQKDDQRQAAQRRLDYELGVITKTGFASYFLIVADFVNEAKKRGILVGPGRGSAAGSIVSYLTNITGLDPLHYNLLFERFLNPERVSMPDIDLDFADDRRDEVIDYVREKYGNQHVAQIITFGTMAARAAVRDAGRALGFPYVFCDRVAKSVPPFLTFEQALDQSGELREMYDEDPQAKRLIDTARKLEGVCRHASTHAAGVVITEEPLIKHVPLQLASTSKDQGDVVVTQYAMNDVEALGLLKMDFLGLKNLTIIQDTIDRIRARHDKKIDINNLPLDDEATYQLLKEGKTTGVFQLESAGMKRWLKELKPTEFEDIISMVALYRPGPMDSIPDFVAAKHGRRDITYLHPILKPILEKTYGVIVTQDQVLQIAREFAGFTYGEADILRKAVGKKIKKLLAEQREKFVHGAASNKKIDKKTAVRVWDFIEPFARYGFNRAHAACYAMIAYQTAYLKAKHPAEFMAALLTSDEGNVDRQAIEVAEALSLNLKVLPPDVNESDHNFTVVTVDGEEVIRFGLGAIKNVGEGVVTALVEEREENGKYTDLLDVFRRANSKDFNRKSVESLIRAGAFDCLAERNYLLENLEKLLNFNRSLHRKIDAGQQGLFGNSSTPLSPPRISLDEVPAASQDECLAWEKELLGLYISDHPLKNLAGDLQDVATPLAELTVLSTAGEAARVRVAGIITRITRITTKRQQQMMFVQLEDMAGKVEVLVFPTLLEKTEDLWVDGVKVLVEGKISDKEGEVKVLADAVWVIEATSLAATVKSLPPLKNGYQPAKPSSESARRMVIRLQNTLPKDALHKLRQVLTEYNKGKEGNMLVELQVQRNGGFDTIATNFCLPRDTAVADLLEEIVGQQALDYR
ncbi:MAG: DNA polymerase III subunit alpha [bacterium]